MKYLVAPFFLTLLMGIGSNAEAQSTASNSMDEMMVKGSVTGAQLGSLICEDANGQRVLCSGNLEETILGVATNVPYVTINKPTNPNESKFIFEAFVSVDNGNISKGDYLRVNKGGTLALANDGTGAYAVALADLSATGKIRVKLIAK